MYDIVEVNEETDMVIASAPRANYVIYKDHIIEFPSTHGNNRVIERNDEQFGESIANIMEHHLHDFLWAMKMDNMFGINDLNVDLPDLYNYFIVFNIAWEFITIFRNVLDKGKNINDFREGPFTNYLEKQRDKKGETGIVLKVYASRLWIFKQSNWNGKKTLRFKTTYDLPDSFKYIYKAAQGEVVSISEIMDYIDKWQKDNNRPIFDISLLNKKGDTEYRWFRYLGDLSS